MTIPNSPDMSTSLRVIKNTGFLYFRLLLTMVVSLWTTRIILQALGTDNFGIYNVVGGAIALLGFLNAAMASATQRFMNVGEGMNDIHSQKIIFNTAVVLHLLLGLIFGLFLFGTAFIFFNGVLDIPQTRIKAAVIVYGCMAVSTIFTITTVPYEAAINAHENMKWYAIIGIADVILKLFIAYIIIWVNHDKLILYGLLMALVPLINLTAMRIYCRRKYEECHLNFKLYFDFGKMKEIGTFASWNLINTFTSMTTQYGLNIVINHFFGVVLNAAQGIANQVSGVLFALSQNALKALNPIIFKSRGKNNEARMNYVTLVSCKITYSIFAFFSFPLIFMMPQVLSLWLINVPEWASLFCQLQLVRLLTETLTLGITTSILANGRVKYFNIIKGVINILPLLITPILFYYKLEPYWMYIVWISSWSILGGLSNLYFAHRLHNLSIAAYFNNVALPTGIITILSSGIFFIGILYNFQDNFILMIMLLIIYLIVFSISFWRIILSSYERELFLSFFKKLTAHKF